MKLKLLYAETLAGLSQALDAFQEANSLEIGHWRAVLPDHETGIVETVDGFYLLLRYLPTP